VARVDSSRKRALDNTMHRNDIARLMLELKNQINAAN